MADNATENVTASFVLTRGLLRRMEEVTARLAQVEPFKSTGVRPSKSLVLRYVIEQGLDAIERGDAPKPGGEESP